ncbi:MAG: hypothetical protein KBD78_08185 [Oligoflexales bacterium]|nr:hypothetical protein [Oligoflexales bacterium]
MKNVLTKGVFFVLLFSMISFASYADDAQKNADQGTMTEKAKAKIDSSHPVKVMKNEPNKLNNKAIEVEAKAKEKMKKDDSEPGALDKAKAKYNSSKETAKSKVADVKAKAKEMTQPKPSEKKEPSMKEKAQAKIDAEKASLKQEKTSIEDKAKEKEKALKNKWTK